eukprot:CAMPEP_0175561570 /NCGR_PEP_ID=MMETSP0096-20121207/37478_1 /TAXON_ID=311494 /ORGANISM="Alexandrium monilatum, Strain CCMP3105" /LENGTH=111 /DNA_ID=CAMNT_0016864793 /DNA_START=426 /DNA_END=757 /DNA_ORIENTATION=-
MSSCNLCFSGTDRLPAPASARASVPCVAATSSASVRSSCCATRSVREHRQALRVRKRVDSAAVAAATAVPSSSPRIPPARVGELPGPLQQSRQCALKVSPLLARRALAEAR